ncbi:MAG: hypothetical protein O7G84_13590 [Gammaproteobacteria bacterium]|nr:hypothetical protein [Gammaproteobacteria bacterium]
MPIPKREWVGTFDGLRLDPQNPDWTLVYVIVGDGSTVAAIPTEEAKALLAEVGLGARVKLSVDISITPHLDKETP